MGDFLSSEKLPTGGRKMLSVLRHNGQMDQPRYYLKEWREYRGFTLEELAEEVGYAQRGGLQKIEKAKKNLTWARLILIAKALDISPGDVFFPPPVGARAQLASDIKRLNEDDLEPVADLVKSLLKRDARLRA